MYVLNGGQSSQPIEISRTDRTAEQEADDVADHMATGGAASAASVTRVASASSSVEAALGSGRPLPDPVRAGFEHRLSADLSAVRISDDDRSIQLADALGANAFTVGHRIAFGAGQLAPDTPWGNRLLAHELAHTIHQSGGASDHGISTAPLAVARQPKGGRPDPGVRQREAGSPAQVRGRALEQRVIQAVESSTQLTTQLNSAVDGGIGHVDAMLHDLGAVADKYQMAYRSYERVLAAGKAHAATMDALSDAVIGVLIGAGVGLSLGLALPAAAGANLAMNTWIQVRNGVVKALATAAWKGRGAGSGQMAPAEGLAAFEEAHPAMQRLRAVREGARLYRDLALLSTRVKGLGDINALASGGQADCRELEIRGWHRSLSEIQIEGRVQLIEQDTEAQAAVKDAIENLSTAVQDARIAASLAKDEVDLRRMEHDIWIHWMASLSPEAALILDSDPIEERLSWLGILAKRGMINRPERAWQSTLNWGVGAWHSDENSREGARLAAKGTEALRMVGQTGQFKRRNEQFGSFTDKTGRQWSAAPQVRSRSSLELEGATVVVTKADPSGALLWVDLPAAAAEDRRRLYTARQLPGKTVTLTGILEGVGIGGNMRYSARASSAEFPGHTWPAEMSPRYAGRPTEGGAVVVMHVDPSGTLICRPRGEELFR